MSGSFTPAIFILSKNSSPTQTSSGIGVLKPKESTMGKNHLVETAQLPQWKALLNAKC